MHWIGGSFELRETNALADGIVRAEIFLRESLVDDGEFFRPVHFRFREWPPSQELNLQHGEIAFAAKLIKRVPFFRVRLAGDLDIGTDPTVRRQSTRLRGLDYSGHGFQPQQKGTKKASDLIGGLVPVFGKGKPGYKNVIRLQTEMNFAESYKAAHHKACADQERKRESNFEDNDGVAQAAVAKTSAYSFAAVAQRIVEITASGLQRRDEAKDSAVAIETPSVKSRTLTLRRIDSFGRE